MSVLADLRSRLAHHTCPGETCGDLLCLAAREIEREQLRAQKAEMAIGMALAHPECCEDVLRAYYAQPAQPPAPEIERIEALEAQALRWLSHHTDRNPNSRTVANELIEAIPALLAERKELLRRVEEAEASLANVAEARRAAWMREPLANHPWSMLALGVWEDLKSLLRERDALRSQLAEAQSAQARAVAEAPVRFTCLYHRCPTHVGVPQLNTTEHSGAECGACAADMGRVAAAIAAAPKAQHG